MKIKELLGNIRFYVLLKSFLISVIVYLWVKNSIPEGSLQVIRLSQIYGLLSVIYLYFTLLAGPFCYLFRWFPFRGEYLKSRRAIGFSVFYFALLHSYYSFFKGLGGFAGLGFLENKYLTTVVIGAIALLIFTLMAITAFDYMIEKLTFPKWKLLHRLIYIAGILVLIHMLMLGSHFQDLSEALPKIFFIAFSFLFILEADRVDAWFRAKLDIPRFQIVLVLTISSLSIYGFNIFFPGKGGALTFGIHSQHIQIAKDAQNGIGSNLPNLPGLQGDRTRRYTVSFVNSENPQPNREIELKFKVNDAASGNSVTLFNKVYEKIAHLVIVDGTLDYFNHIHPELDTKGNFIIKTTLPKKGIYHLYISFQPAGAIEQQFGFTLNVGNVENQEFSKATADTNLTKTFENYEVTLDYPKPLDASKLSIGEQKLKFTIKDTKTGEPVSNLKPYLGAFGHLVMVNEKNFEYIHVHPTNLTAPKPDENGGPEVEFMPLGLYGPIKPGIYRVFGQFNPDGKLFVSDFTISIE